MLKRKIIRINEEKCDGCGNCIPNCPEGAIQVIDGKARLISDLFCDGLGACLGECPLDAIAIEERPAEPYNEIKVMENIVRQGENVIQAHLEHLKKHNESEYLDQAINYLKKNNMEIPGKFDKLRSTRKPVPQVGRSKPITTNQEVMNSELGQWPVQLNLVSPSAPYFKDADLIIAADCVPFAYPSFHRDFLKGKILLIGCPKFDDTEYYIDKLTEIFKQNNIKSVTVVHMEVPCCFGLSAIVKDALKKSHKNIALNDVNISIKGKILAPVQ